MKKEEIPDIGQKIQIERLDPTFTFAGEQLVSQVFDKIDDYILFIATPILHNQRVSISIGENLQITYVKQNVGVFGFKAKVIGKKKVSEELSYLKIERLGDIFKEQRRNFFRLEIALPIKVKTMDSKYEEPMEIDGFTKDISGGGLRFIAEKPLKLNSRVEITIHLEEESVVVQGRIVRCLLSIELNSKYDIGIMFENIDEKIRTKLIAFIFENQRKMREKGLI
ncbi:MAG TPA: flagellar brake protein [Clostridiales bacterium]|nr:flagellar brake protein [Clostridiales bacterium]